MVASTLGVAEEQAFGAEPGETVELHPWAREMYRLGLSFNGNERSKLFLGRGDGTFEDLSDLCGADSPLDGRALLTADFDDDGDVDIFTHNIQRERHNLFRNELAGAGKHLKLRLRATGSQHEAIGAVVTVHGPRGAHAQLLSRGAGFLSCQGPELVFGLGDAPAAEVEVRWPDGSTESFGRVEAGSAMLLVEGEGRPRPRARRAFTLRDPMPPGLRRGIGEKVPTLVLVDAGGERRTVRVSELAQGRTVLLNFWASYCLPCVRELPALVAEHEKPDRVVVAVSVDGPSAFGRAQDALDEAGATFDSHFISFDDADNEQGLDELVDLLRLAIPTTLVLGPDGEIRDVIRGPLGAE